MTPIIDNPAIDPYLAYLYLPRLYLSALIMHTTRAREQ